MAIELRVEMICVDTEPENPAANGIILHSAKITTLLSEVQDMGGILAIAAHRIEAVSGEVLEDIKDQIEVMSRQPG